MLKIEIRGKKAIIQGYVNTVERESRVLPKQMCQSATGDFVEKVRSKTFEKALQKANNVEVRYNHNRKLGSTKEQTLELYEDNIGLYAKAIIEDEEVVQKARNKELRGWSFGFNTLIDSWEVTTDGTQRRVLEEIDLKEVSILSETPAYIATSIEMRGSDCLIVETRGQEENIELTEIEEKKKEETISYQIQENELELLKIRR